MDAGAGKGDVLDLGWAAGFGLRNIDLTESSASYGNFTLSYRNFEDVYGNSARNRLLGDDGDNMFKGLAGRDFFDGRVAMTEFSAGKAMTEPMVAPGTTNCTARPFRMCSTVALASIG